MGDIEMLGGSGFSMEKTEESEIQRGGGGGAIEMFGGSNFSMIHTPIGSEQKGSGDKGIDMVGLQGLVHKEDHISFYGSKEPADKGKV